jgi:hypothetical protein
MTAGAWCKVLPALLTLTCLGIAAAEPARQLGFLRAAPQGENSEGPMAHAPRAPDSTARQALGESAFYDPDNPDLQAFAELRRSRGEPAAG